MPEPRRISVMLALIVSACSDAPRATADQAHLAERPQVEPESETEVEPESETGNEPESENESENEIETTATEAQTRTAATSNREPFWGEVVMMFERVEDADGDDVEGPYVMLSPIERQPKPSGVPTGFVYVHAGYWEMRNIREVPTEVSTVIVAGAEGSCEARVVRALEVHAFHPPVFNDSGSDGESTFRALELRGCPRGGSFGVVGAESVAVHPLERESMTTLASAELVALVRESDDADGWAPPLDGGEFRVRRFPELGFDVVAGQSAWVVRDGVVLHEQLGGVATHLYHAGPLVLFAMSTPSEGWVASIDDFHPAPVRCVVRDESGTELNIRAAPRGSADVAGSLVNGEEVLVYERRGSWRRLTSHRQPEARWVHASGLRCPP